VYFDDERWKLRYLVVDTGRWLPGRKALVAPSAASQTENAKVLRLDLSREDIERAPDMDDDPPLSRLMQQARDHEYRYPYSGPYLWAAVPMIAASALARDPVRRKEARELKRRAAQTHLRSGSEVVGYRIRAADGEIGHVEDFIVDDVDWAITGMVVDTRNWLPGKKVVLPPSAIEQIDWESGTVSVTLSRDELRGSPAAE
jgi:hypothetical protein